MWKTYNVRAEKLENTTKKRKLLGSTTENILTNSKTK
jgi:hypothetical protein